MRLSTLHNVIHQAESAAPDVTFDVALVGQDGLVLQVFRISEVFVDDRIGLINIVFDQNKPVQP